MKKYVAVWGAMFFCVICLSLYLMLETLNTSPSRYNDIDPESLLNFERKIDGIERDIIHNQEIIKEIKAAVREVNNEDKESVAKLQGILDEQNKKLIYNQDKLKKLQGEETGKIPQNPDNVIHMKIDREKPHHKMPDNDDSISLKGQYGVVHKEVSVSQGMCSWADEPSKKAEIRMDEVVDSLPFDNPDGGAWKQGWEVTYDKNKWTSSHKLRVFVVPHSHNDPGWVKTYDRYYQDQTRHIFNNMLQKLVQYPKLKFMYAEMSFFHMWWNEISDDKKQTVKQLIEEKRLEIVTGGWVMNDEANTHYFAMLDQLLEGHQWLDGTLGVKPSAGWAIDPFGHTPTMAYLLRRSGFNNMLIQRVHYAVKKYLAKNSNLEFMWRQNWDRYGNTDILCHMMPFYSYDIPHTCGPEPAVCCQFDFRRLPGSSYSCPWKKAPQAITDSNVAERAQLIIDQWKKKATLYRTSTVFAPLGDDFRYDKADEWDLQYNNYQALFDYINSNPQLGVEAHFGTLSDYFNSIYEEAQVKPGLAPNNIQSLSGDFFTYADKDDHYWSGYFTSRPFQKNLNRVMESNLRAAEIIFSMATTLSRRQGNKNFPANMFMEKMIEARRNLGLFQHHDGITGTAKDFVVVDYGNRLLGSLNAVKTVIKECATYLTLEDKTVYGFDEVSPWFDVDERRPEHDSLPEKTVIKLGQEGDNVARPVMFYNSLAYSREQIVKLHISYPHVIVKDSEGQTVLSQVEPYWNEDNQVAYDRYKVSFRVTVPALGIVRYTIQRTKDYSNKLNFYASVLVFNSDDSETNNESPFSVQKSEGADFSLENSFMKATFSGGNGLLQSITNKETSITHSTKLEFVRYGTKAHSGDRSGAYLFLPDGPAKAYTNPTPPTVHVIKGPVVSEVHVYMKMVTHIVRLYNTSGIDGMSLDMQNIVDITSATNTEMVVRIHTDISNTGGEFYTDLNGFQLQRHKNYEKLTLQGNVYPMPTMAFIEDSKNRFSILSANSLGFANLKPGVVDVFLDRRLNQDDSRGLGQGVTDSKLTPSRFRLLLEHRHKGTYNKDKATVLASLLSHQTSLHLIHPTFVIPPFSGHSSSFPKQHNLSPMQNELPCDVHLLNLRTMQNRDDGPDRLTPKNTAGLFLHRLGLDCGFPNKGLMCKAATGEVIMSGLFKDMRTDIAQQASLTLMYEEKEIDTTELLDLEPMEISSYVVTLQ